MVQPRDTRQRIVDSLDLLTTPVRDAWVATASAESPPRAHLVPLSLAWVDGRLVICTPGSSPTGTNLLATGRAVLTVGSTRDVLHIEARLASHVAVGLAETELAQAFADRADWDPRGDGSGGYEFFVMEPVRMQAWREVDEIPGRTIMRDGRWLA